MDWFILIRVVPLTLLCFMVVVEMYVLWRDRMLWARQSDFAILIADIVVLTAGILLYSLILFGGGAEYYIVRVGAASTILITLFILNHIKNFWDRFM